MNTPASTLPAATPRARFAIDTGPPDLHVITASGELDTSAAARLLRLVDARLRLRELGHVATRHIVVDLGGVHHTTPGALKVLGRARDAALRHGVSFALAGTARLTTLPLPTRQALYRFTTYPTLGAARAAIAQRAERTG